MKDIIVRTLLYASIALVPISCGTRKVATVITENKAIEDAKSKEQANTQTTDTHKGTDTQTSKTAKIDEKQEQRITELFNENGSLRSRITELLNSRSTDNSSSARNRTFDETKIKIKSYLRNIDTHRTKTTYVKKKTTSSERYGFGIVGLLVGLVAGAWLWPKVKGLSL